MKKRKTLHSYGSHKYRVRVVEDADGVMVVWREHGLRRQNSFPKTPNGRKEAAAWAQSFADARTHRNVQQSPRITIRALWEAYKGSEFSALRDRSKALYTEAWNRFELVAGKNFIADDLDVALMGSVRGALERQGLRVNTVRQTMHQVKRVYAFGERADLINRNKAHLYVFKVAKDAQPESPAEYRKDEATKILAQFDPNKGSQWRPFVALSLCILQGVRQRSVLNLKWADVDFEAGTVKWVKQFSKTGEEFTQPLRPGARAALEVARHWHARDEVRSPWVLPSGSTLSKRETYSIQSLWAALMRAEKAAGVEHKPYRGGHGFRRMLAGDVAEITGNAMLGLQSIGDRDPKQLGRYVKKRDDQMSDAFRALDAQDLKEGHTEGGNQTATTAENAQPGETQVVAE